MQIQLTFDHVRVPYTYVCTYCAAIRRSLAPILLVARIVVRRVSLFLDGKRPSMMGDRPLSDPKHDALRFLAAAEAPHALVRVCIEHMRAALLRGGLTLADVGTTDEHLTDLLGRAKSSHL